MARKLKVTILNCLEEDARFGIVQTINLVSQWMITNQISAVSRYYDHTEGNTVLHVYIRDFPFIRMIIKVNRRDETRYIPLNAALLDFLLKYRELLRLERIKRHAHS